MFAALGLDSLCRLIPRARSDATLIVRLDAVGDFFLWLRDGAVDITGFARARGGPVVLLANPICAQFARETGLWDEVLEIDADTFGLNPIYRLKSIFMVRRLGPALLIQPRASRSLWLEDAIARISGAPEKIAATGTLFRATQSQRNLGDRFYDRLIPIDGTFGVHESRRNAQFAAGLVGKAPTAFRFDPPPSGDSVNSVVVALGAGARGRVWPLEKLATVVAHIGDRYPHLRLVVMGVPDDASDAESLGKLSGARLENRVGATTLAQFAAAIATSRLVICNESAAYHIAMAYQRNTVCLLGGGHYGNFAPYPASADTRDAGPGRAIDVVVPMDCFGCNWRCIYPRTSSGAFSCVDAIAVDVVIAAVDRLLAGARVGA
jgi:ADP-heptose:LPS heptosyltransferase